MIYNISKLPNLETQILGKTFFHEPTTASTQTVVKDLLAQGYGSGTTVLADHQTDGKGTKGRTWFSLEEPQIYLSFLIAKKDLPFSEVPMLNIVLGICMVRYLRDLGIPNCSLKWPNDVYIGQKKVCGILSELVLHGWNAFVISGVGLNYEGDSKSFSPELHATATIVKEHTEDLPDRLTFVAEYLFRLECYLDQIRQDSVRIFQRDFEALWRYRNQTISVRDGGNEYQGTATSIDKDGALLLETKQGNKRILTGDIFIPTTIL